MKLSNKAKKNIAKGSVAIGVAGAVASATVIAFKNKKNQQKARELLKKVKSEGSKLVDRAGGKLKKTNTKAKAVNPKSKTKKKTVKK